MEKEVERGQYSKLGWHPTRGQFFKCQFGVLLLNWQFSFQSAGILQIWNFAVFLPNSYCLPGLANQPTFQPQQAFYKLETFVSIGNFSFNWQSLRTKKLTKTMESERCRRGASHPSLHLHVLHEVSLPLPLYSRICLVIRMSSRYVHTVGTPDKPNVLFPLSYFRLVP